jgi:hypothetical protein
MVSFNDVKVTSLTKSAFVLLFKSGAWVGCHVGSYYAKAVPSGNPLAILNVVWLSTEKSINRQLYCKNLRKKIKVKIGK